jgi:hypothetical protein
MRRVAALGCLIAICSFCAMASERVDFTSLPVEAQAAISAAMRQNPAARYPATIQNSALTASDGVNGDEFGISVAIDGNTVVVGAATATFNGKAGPGAVYVFVKPADGWTNMTQVAKLAASDGQNNDQFGCSVGISGNTVVVGASEATVNQNTVQGAAYVFVKPTTGWNNMTETAKLTALDGASFARFGLASGISGNTIVIGAPFGNDGNRLGTAYVFVEPNGGWTNMTQTAELTASDGLDGDDLGVSVSISDSTIIAGADDNGYKPGAAYVFVEPPGGWVDATETAKLTTSDGEVGDAFGVSASIGGDTAVVSANQNAVGGAAYVFVEPSGGWTNMTETAELTVGAGPAGFGSAVAISGNTILAGNNEVADVTGRAYVFLKPASGWRNTSKYTRQLGISFRYGYDDFGVSAAISGRTGVVGAVNAPTSLPCRNGICTIGPGEAFVFTAKP